MLLEEFEFTGFAGCSFASDPPFHSCFDAAEESEVCSLSATSAQCSSKLLEIGGDTLHDFAYAAGSFPGSDACV